MSEIEKKIDHK